MRKSLKLVALALLFSFPGGVASAWAAPADPVPAPVAQPAASAPAPSIRASLESLRHSPLVLAPARPAAAAAQAPAQSGGGRHLSGAAKAAIWIAAVTVTSAWAYKTFSVTRGTD
jgi:hypothetical protein